MLCCIFECFLFNNLFRFTGLLEVETRPPNSTALDINKLGIIDASVARVLLAGHQLETLW